MNGRQRGFSLMEIMVAVAIVGILSAIALPAYNQHILRTKLSGGFTSLGTVELTAEQYWANNRTYVGLDTSGRLPAAITDFTFAASNLGVSTFTVTATGRAAALGFTYTIDHTGAKKTTQVPTGWTTSTTCWVDRKGGLCTQ